MMLSGMLARRRQPGAHRGWVLRGLGEPMHASNAPALSCPSTPPSNAAQAILLSKVMLVIMYLPREIPARAPPRGVDEETSCCGRREEKG